MFSDIRNKAKNIFSQIGYPSTKEERWRYTNTKNFNNCVSENVKKSVFKLDEIDLPENSYNIIIYNGQLIKWDMKLEGIKIQNYDNLINTSTHPENFLKVSDFTYNGVVAHNTSAFTDALHLTINEDFKLETPINIISVTRNLKSDKIIFPRVYIHAKSNSKSKIYIQHMDYQAKCAINSVFEFFCESSSEIEVIQSSNSKNQEIIDSIFFHQEDNSQIKFFSTAFGGKLYRSNINISINGEGCDNNFGVLILGSDRDHIDYNININHFSGHSTSHFSCKSLLKDRSIGIFNGKILVAEGASGTDSTLNNNNLLLSDKSEIQSNPQLEINCEDVKCAHGSTSGDLDKNALFYLRSRGINEEDARGILVEGFINKLLSSFSLKFLSLDQRIKEWI